MPTTPTSLADALREIERLRAENEALKVRNEKLESLLTFALDGLKSTPHSWGLDITHVKK